MLKPMYDNMLIEPVKADTKTKGGIYISNPDRQKEYAEGVVIAVGDGYRVDGGLQPLSVKVGDTIVYRKMTEVMIDADDKEYFLVSEANVLAIK